MLVVVGQNRNPTSVINRAGGVISGSGGAKAQMSFLSRLDDDGEQVHLLLGEVCKLRVGEVGSDAAVCVADAQHGTSFRVDGPSALRPTPVDRQRARCSQLRRGNLTISTEPKFVGRPVNREDEPGRPFPILPEIIEDRN